MIKDRFPYRILVLEDNPGDLALIQDFLEETILQPYISQATSFGQGLRLLEEAQPPYDVVLLDLTLPDKSGEPLISEIIASHPELPVIVLTGYSDISFSVRSLSLGVADYLVKDDLTAVSLYKSIVYNIERKKNLIRLEESERRYSDLFHLSPQPMWVYEHGSFRFLDVNNAAVGRYGYSREEFLDMSIVDIRPLEETSRMERILQGPYPQVHTYLQGIHRHRTKNGEIIQVEQHSSAIPFKGKQAEVVLANDITERVNYIHAIELQNTRLREIGWMQSHTVRAPLTRMMSIVEMIRKHPVAGIDKSELLDHLMLSAQELDGIIR